MTTKCAVEIKTDLSGRDGVDLSVVMNTNVSNKHQQVIEGLPYLHSNVFISVEELIVAQENRNGQSKLIEDGKGLVQGLGITWAKLYWISRKPQGTGQKTCLEQSASRSPNQFCSLIAVTDEAFDSVGVSRYLEGEELCPGSRLWSQRCLVSGISTFENFGEQSNLRKIPPKGGLDSEIAYHLRTLSHLEPRCGMCVSLCRSMNWRKPSIVKL